VPNAATVRFWAGARHAAGHPEELTSAVTIRQLRNDLGQRPALAPALAAASFLVDGTRATDDTTIRAGAVVDVLPPFAGG